MQVSVVKMDEKRRIARQLSQTAPRTLAGRLESSTRVLFGIAVVSYFVKMVKGLFKELDSE
jgi:hypothetical protein